VVRLKSGGPKMTITMEMYPGGYTCQWFSGSELSSGFFSDSVLELVAEEKSPQ
jgi:uncharacterized protein YodC (DUF2158 family)